MKITSKLLNAAIIVLGFFLNETSSAQTLFVPGGTGSNGVGASGNTAVGVGTSTPYGVFTVKGYSSVFLESAGVHGIQFRPNESGYNSIFSDYFSGTTSLPLTLGTYTNKQSITIISNGNVGIGIISPTIAKLQILGSIGTTKTSFLTSDGVNSSFRIGHPSSGVAAIGGNTGHTLQFGGFENGNASFTPLMTLLPSGNLGVGTTTPGAKLNIAATDYTGLIVNTTHTGSYGYCINALVNQAFTKAISIDLNGVTNFLVYGNGSTYAREVTVQQGNFPDYVFDENYKINNLLEVENYIKKFKHLPGVPTANEIKANGLNVSEMLAKQMEKIEELTLYLIALKKKNDELEAIIKAK